MTFKCSATIVILQYLLLSACNCVLSQGQATEIIRHPRDQTVRCLEAAEFSCRASDAGYINWRVNGTSRNRLPLFRDTSVEGGFLENSSTWSTLTFTNSRPHYNGTSVQCVAGVGGSGAPPVRSDVAYLRVLRTDRCQQGPTDGHSPTHDTFTHKTPTRHPMHTTHATSSSVLSGLNAVVLMVHFVLVLYIQP